MSRNRKRLVLISGALTCLVGLAVALLGRRIVAPKSEIPEQADVVVVLAGGQGERLTKALELIDAGVAPVLLISTGNMLWPGWEDLAPLCARPQEFEVLCVEPEIPDNTRGEAKIISQMAEDNGWSSMALVTSEYHLHRATLNFERCFDGDLYPVAAPFPLTAGLAGHEALGILHAELIERHCA